MNIVWETRPAQAHLEMRVWAQEQADTREILNVRGGSLWTSSGREKWVPIRGWSKKSAFFGHKFPQRTTTPPRAMYGGGGKVESRGQKVRNWKEDTQCFYENPKWQKCV